MVQRQKDLVSVLIPAYRHEAFVAECLASVAKQDYPSIEVVFIDDSSPDGTFAAATAALKGFPAPVHVVRHEVNRGLCATLNEALGRSRGEFVAVLASDDHFTPGRVRRHVEALKAVPGAAVAWSDFEMITLKGDTFGIKDGRLPARELYEALLLMEVPIFTQASTIRASCLDEIGGFDESVRFEDWDILLRLAQRFAGVYVPGVATRVRYSETGLSKRLADRSEDFLRIIEKHRDDPRARRLGWNKILGRTLGRVAAQNLLEGRRRGALAYAMRALWAAPGELAPLRTAAAALVGPRARAAVSRLRRVVEG